MESQNEHHEARKRPKELGKWNLHENVIWLVGLFWAFGVSIFIYSIVS